MNLTHKIIKWEKPNYHAVVLIGRVLLGIAIAFKGIVFINNYALLENLLRNSTLNWFAESFWIWYIALSSLLCGIFIVTGLFTRLAILLQIPVLTGAVLFINPGEHAFYFHGEFLLSLLVLIVLIYFLVKGPGEVSMDNYLRNHEI